MTGTAEDAQQPDGGGGTAPGRIVDIPQSWPVVRTQERYRGSKCGLTTDWVQMPGAGGAGTSVARRDRMDHMGAAAVLALDDDDRVLLLRQYRHAVGHLLWELPAGLLDVPGESPVATARRELLEEAGYSAEHWYELVDFFPTPGFSTERIHIFLARGLTEVPEKEVAFERVHEEAHMSAAWVPLQEAVRAVQEGRVHNGATLVGVMSAFIAAREGFASLRRPEAT